MEKKIVEELNSNLTRYTHINNKGEVTWINYVFVWIDVNKFISYTICKSDDYIERQYRINNQLVSTKLYYKYGNNTAYSRKVF